MTAPSEAASDAAPEGGRRARSAALVTAGILLSRLFGLVRQRLIAHFLGTSGAADALMAALRVGNITQNLLGEGTLSAAFIPIYAKLRGEGRHEDASRFAWASLGWLLVAVAVLTGAGVALAPWITRGLAAGFEGERYEQTVSMVRIAFPMTGVLVIAAWALGVLNAHRRFFLSYAAPVVWNLAQITALLVVGGVLSWSSYPIARAAAYGALVGAALQVLLLGIPARRALGGGRPRLEIIDSVRTCARRVPAALLGRGAIQISGLVDTLLVSFLGTGAAASFMYAQTLYLLPMSVLGTGEAAVALPDTASIGTNDAAKVEAQKRLAQSIGRVLLLAWPAALVLGLLSAPMVALVFQTGSFDAQATREVALVLSVYGFAILANAISRVLSATCFALGDPHRPARYALVRVAVSTAVSLLLMQRFGVPGVVAGAAVAAWIELGLLLVRVRHLLGGVSFASIRFGRIGLLGVGSVVPAAALYHALGDWTSVPLLSSAVPLALSGIAFIVLARLLGLGGLRSLLGR